MPSHWSGTVEDRYARLEQAGRRCDGNSRRCTHSASVVYTLRPAVEWEPVPDAESVTKQSCSRHVQQFINNSAYVVLHTRKLPERPAGKPHPHTTW